MLRGSVSHQALIRHGLGRREHAGMAADLADAGAALALRDAGDDEGEVSQHGAASAGS